MSFHASGLLTFKMLIVWKVKPQNAHPLLLATPNRYATGSSTSKPKSTRPSFSLASVSSLLQLKSSRVIFGNLASELRQQRQKRSMQNAFTSGHAHSNSLTALLS